MRLFLVEQNYISDNFNSLHLQTFVGQKLNNVGVLMELSDGSTVLIGDNGCVFDEDCWEEEYPVVNRYAVVVNQKLLKEKNNVK